MPNVLLPYYPTVDRYVISKWMGSVAINRMHEDKPIISFVELIASKNLITFWFINFINELIVTAKRHQIVLPIVLSIDFVL